MPTFRSPCRTAASSVSRRRCAPCFVSAPVSRSPWQAAPATGMAPAGAGAPLAPLCEVRRAPGCASRRALMSAVVRAPPPTLPAACRARLPATVSAIPSAHAPRRLPTAGFPGADFPFASPSKFMANGTPFGVKNSHLPHLDAEAATGSTGCAAVRPGRLPAPNPSWERRMPCDGGVSYETVTSFDINGLRVFAASHIADCRGRRS